MVVVLHRGKMQSFVISVFVCLSVCLKFCALAYLRFCVSFSTFSERDACSHSSVEFWLQCSYVLFVTDKFS